MWLFVYNILMFIYNCIHNIFFPLTAAADQALVLLYKPFAAAGAFLGELGTLAFTVLHLSLRTLYYIVALWLLIYMLNLLYHFVQHRDFTLRVNFILGLAHVGTIRDKTNKH